MFWQMNIGALSISSIAIRVSGRIKMMRQSQRTYFGNRCTPAGGMADKNPAYSRFEGGAGGCPRSSPRSCEKIESFPLTRPSATLSPSGGEGGNWHVFFPLALIGGEGPGVRGRVRSSQHLIFSHVPLIGRIFAGVIGILIVCAASTVYAQRTEVPQPLSDFVSR